MRLITLGALSKARLWQEELPLFPCVSAKIFTVSVGAVAAAHRIERRIALELYLPIGPMVQHGILSASLNSIAGDTLNIEVAGCQEGAERLEWTLMQNRDDVMSGIPLWAVTPILNAAQESKIVSNIGAGDLRFFCGAHGMVGSSERLFSQLAIAIINLFALPQNELADDDIRAMLRAVLS